MILGIDIGGTSVKLGLVDRYGYVHAKHTVRVDEDAYRTPILHTVLKAAQDFVRDYPQRITGIGVSATGQIDTGTGIVIGSNGKIPDYEGVCIAGLFRRAFSVPVYVLNDANAALLAEVYIGAAQCRRNVVMLTIGTGIGGGILVDGKLLEGRCGIAGELGRIPFGTDGLCYEDCASASALLRCANIEKNRTYLNIAEIFDAANGEDSTAQTLLSQWMDRLASGIVGLLHIFNPELVLLGGGVSARDELLKGLRRRIAQRAMARFTEGLRIERATLGNDAGFIGAAFYCMERMETMKRETFANIVFVPQENGAKLAYSKESGVRLIEKDGLYFKDLERTGELLPYEDWRLPSWTRAQDLASRMSVEEIAGLMLYSPHQAVPPHPGMPFQGTFDGKSFTDAQCASFALSDQQKHFIETDHIRHILLTMVDDARTSAKWNNALQEMAETMPHGIPVNISSDPRNGAKDADAEFKSGGSDVSKWPEGLGFASCFDPGVAAQFAKDASREYRALGIATALGPQIDLCTEPRWMRLQDTFGPQTQMSIAITKAYCDGMQTTQSVNGWGNESVNTMVKHWPGGGTGEGGRDAHYPFGAYAVYPAENFEEHLKPFTEGAFHLDGPTQYASAVMPYYTVSYGIDCVHGKNVGNSYSEYIIKDLLRGKYNYQGVVCTDWGITGDLLPSMDSFSPRCYGVEDLTVARRHLLCIMNGVDQFGGNSDPAPILEAYALGCEQYGEAEMRARLELSATRLLNNIFRCGLFENPYLDPEESAAIVGCEEFSRHGFEAQQKSIVLLKNRDVLPLKKGIKVYIPNRRLSEQRGFFRNVVPPCEQDPLAGTNFDDTFVRVNTPEEADAAIVFIESPQCNSYSAEEGYLPITLQYRPYTALYAREQSIAGGDPRENGRNRSYKGKTNTAYNEADLDNVLSCRKAMGDKPVIVCITLKNPTVPAEFESAADAIMADFGVSRAASVSVLFGEYAPTGRLPVQLPCDMKTVEEHCEDKAFDLIAYTDTCGNTYDYGFGLTY